LLLEDRRAPPLLLWRPRYVSDDSAPGEFLRAHERSVLCPERRTRIRPKLVTIHHLFGRRTAADERAVCLTHYADYFASGAC